jgi:hypothetical protein
MCSGSVAEGNGFRSSAWEFSAPQEGLGKPQTGEEITIVWKVMTFKLSKILRDMVNDGGVVRDVGGDHSLLRYTANWSMIMTQAADA